MSSGGFPGAGDLYSSLAGRLAAPNGAKRTLTEMERQQLQQALLLTRSVKHKPATPAIHNNNHHHPYYHASPISPLAHPLSPADNIDYSSCSPHPSSLSCSSSTTTTSARSVHGVHQPASLNGVTSQLALIKQQQQQQHQHQQRQLLLLQQQHQLLQRKAGLFPQNNSSGSNNNGGSIFGTVAAGMGGGGGGFGCYSPNTATPHHRLAAAAAPVVQPAQQQPTTERAEVRNRLMELEKQLLDDDDDDDGDGDEGVGPGAPASSVSGGTSPSGADASPAVLDASGWSETMQALLISSVSSCSTPPQPQHHQQQQPQHRQQQQPPTPTTTTSAASSCCSSSSPPTASSSSGSPAPAKQLLMDSATAIAEGNTDCAATNLAILQRNNTLVNTNTASRGAVDAEQRLNGYMATALLSRINNSNSSDSSSPCSSDQLRSPDHLMSTHLLYEACPFFKLGFQATNHAVLDATRGAAVIHILDFDVGQGAQLLPLLSSLADRPAAARPALVKITAVSDPAANPYTTNVGCAAMVRAAGDRLAKAGERAGMAIRFNAVTTRSGGGSEAASSPSSSDQHPPPLSRHAIGCDPGESLVVRLAFHLSRVPDESVTPANPRDDLLRRIRSMNPAVVAIAEQELSGNTAPFLSRFADAQAHYAALFESLHQQPDGPSPTAQLPTEMLARAEECLGRKAANTVGAEGCGRVERCEVLGKWRARLTMAGFRPIPLPAGTVESLRSRSSGRAADGVGGVVAVKEENGGVGFAWNGRTITVASAWRYLVVGSG